MNTDSTLSDRFADSAYEFSMGNFEKSIENFSEMIGHDPNNIEAYFGRGVSYVKTERFDLACEDFDKAIELDPHQAKAYHFRGLVFMRQGEYDRAIKDFDKAIEIKPDYAIAYFSRATAYSEVGDTERAGKDMTTAARLGEANLQGFADYHNIWRTKYDKVEAEVMGERERDWAVTPDLRSFLDG